MNFIEFNKEHLKFNEEQQEYTLEIPRKDMDQSITSVQIVNDEGSLSDADCDIEEDSLTFTISIDYPANLRVNLSSI
ncbi:hypothetical protein P2W68_00890 [Chryseobacterium arthrosphaerae]|uniref:hypothetical protein n=1 Tax=Chryseobacterium arthrosphaerae TaxID=651561 RepID=UPI0023E2C64C|nr:hypothetical protein [Chryseobacterium arthrosphaerae]WES98181.1 hypothetical protein P2W68_00890 [Chryseobacterium arthrosphaerae]